MLYLEKLNWGISSNTKIELKPFPNITIPFFFGCLSLFFIFLYVFISVFFPGRIVVHKTFFSYALFSQEGWNLLLVSYDM